MSKVWAILCFIKSLLRLFFISFFISYLSFVRFLWREQSNQLCYHTGQYTYNTSEMSNSFLPRPHPTQLSLLVQGSVMQRPCTTARRDVLGSGGGRGWVGIKKKKRKTWEFNIVRVPRKPKGIYPLMFGIPDRTLFFFLPLLCPSSSNPPLFLVTICRVASPRGKPSCTSTLKQHVFALHLSLCGEKSSLRLFSFHPSQPPPPLLPSNPRAIPKNFLQGGNGTGQLKRPSPQAVPKPRCTAG